MPYTPVTLKVWELKDCCGFAEYQSSRLESVTGSSLGMFHMFY